VGKAKDTVENLLAEFCQAIDDTGGLVCDEGGESSDPIEGVYAPAASPDWVDLGELYERACSLLGREVKYGEEWPDEDEVDDDDDV
jgi:hypothetical protein